MARLLVVDNYDSFVYNLVQQLEALGGECRVLRNDEATPAALEGADGVVVSPGPGRPEDAGSSEAVIEAAANGAVPTLGVCLGHQALAHVFGGEVVRAPEIVHGKTSRVHHDGKALFQGVPDPFEATRYHSLVVEADSLPEELRVTARTGRGVVMAIRHRSLPLHGVQFHPESILTPDGPTLLANFLALCSGAESASSGVRR